MTNKLPCRLRAALVVAGCLIPAMALAQLDTHFHTRQRSAPQPDIEYGSRTIPLPMLQRPPSPSGAPGTPSAPGGTWLPGSTWRSRNTVCRARRASVARSSGDTVRRTGRTAVTKRTRRSTVGWPWRATVA